VTQALAATQTVNAVAGQTATAEFRITSGLSAGLFVPNSLQIVADPILNEAAPNLANNRTSLAVSEPSRLSFELQTNSPLADTRADRVELWLRRYRDTINTEAAHFRIDPRAVAGAIAWEALFNVAVTEPYFTSFRAVGPGKVHVTDSVFQLLLSPNSRGSGVARQVEDLYAELPT